MVRERREIWVGMLCGVLLSALAVLLPSCAEKSTYNVRCSVRSLGTGKAYLLHTDIETGAIDTLQQSEVVGGTFSFSGSVGYPLMCSIVSGRWSVPLMLENADIEVSGNALMPTEDFCIMGSVSHNDWNSLLEMEKKWNYRRNNLWIEMMKREDLSKEEYNEFMTQYEGYKDSLVGSIEEAVRRSPESAGVAFYIYYAYVNELIDKDDMERMAGGLDGAALEETEYYQFLQDEISLHTGLETNMAAPDFELPRLGGGTASLADYENKYLYLYFTATWCEECRLFDECLKPIYKKYNAKGFEILSVMLDHNADDIEKYISNGSCMWGAACDMKYWQSAVTKRYGVPAIPYGVLVDNRGIVLAVNPQPDILSYYLRKGLK